MSKEDNIDDKRNKIRDKYAIICDYIYYFLPILLTISFVVLIIIVLSNLCTKQMGYLLASWFLVLGLLGLCLGNASLYQQQSFKLLIWVGIFLFIFTIAFSITVDILRVYKSNNGFPFST